MSTRTQFDTSSTMLGSFFSGDSNTVLQIPHYQRGYSWESEHLDDFFQDLIEQSRLKNEQYFFGTITTIDDKQKQENFDGNWYLLVDGQQRITTSIIFLTCLRDIFYEMNLRTMEEIEKEIFNMDIQSY
mgnify:CR=1 FL=1